jgi:predicted RNase H-like HicB family nuclease
MIGFLLKGPFIINDWRLIPEDSGTYVPDLPDVISVGDSREEVERLILEAIEFHLEGLREEGLPIPPPSSFAGVIEIDSVV